MVASRITKSVALAFVSIGLADCVPRVTIADETSAGGEGGELATGGNVGIAGSSSNGGGKSSGGESSKGGAAGAGTAGGGAAGRGTGGDVGDAGAGALSGTGGMAGSACDADVSNGTAHLSLEDYCELFHGCPETFEDAVMRFGMFCPILSNVVRTGCGVQWVAYSGGYTTGSYAFDEASGELVWASESGDTQHGPCDVGRYTGGVAPSTCEDASECSLCEDVADPPVCRFDCDCNEPPGVDPCHDPTSCGCYCQRIAQQ